MSFFWLVGWLGLFMRGRGGGSKTNLFYQLWKCQYPIFGWSTVFSGFFGLLLNKKWFLFFVLFELLVKILKRHVLHFHEAKVNLRIFYLFICLFILLCVSFLSFFWLVSSVGSFCAGRGWRIQNKPVISSENVSHILLFRKRNKKIWFHCLTTWVDHPTV